MEAEIGLMQPQASHALKDRSVSWMLWCHWPGCSSERDGARYLLGDDEWCCFWSQKTDLTVQGWGTVLKSATSRKSLLPLLKECTKSWEHTPRCPRAHLGTGKQEPALDAEDLMGAGSQGDTAVPRRQAGAHSGSLAPSPVLTQRQSPARCPILATLSWPHEYKLSSRKYTLYIFFLNFMPHVTEPGAQCVLERRWNVWIPAPTPSLIRYNFGWVA